MTLNHANGIHARQDANATEAISSGATGSEICVVCHRPLTKRGADGECLRCLVGFALVPGDDPPDPACASVAADPGLQTVVYGHFELEKAEDGSLLELGRGAMGTTYRARDTVLRAAVALKVIDQSVAQHPAARARFLREARAAANLHHPNVANVSHYGEQGGQCYYVMELIEGETVESRVRREGPLPLPLALEIAAQVARALVAAEARGVVHRDLKPSNLMLAATGPEAGKADIPMVKVIDFGLAKVVSGMDAEEKGAADTRSGFVGTPAFASPEQYARTEDTRIDTRSDIYSLGVTLWYLLCARTPFLGNSLEEIHAQQIKEPLPLSPLAIARIPAPVVSLLQSMLAVCPRDRLQSARELLDAITHCQETFPFAGGRSAPRSGNRRRWTLAVSLLVAGGVAAAAWRYFHGPPPPVTDTSIAVLPFENLSPDKADGFFTVGMQDEITDDLARIKHLKVIGSESTRAYPPGSRDFGRIGRELGVSHLLEGSLRREGEKMHISVRLVDVNHPAHPWSEQYHRQLADVFAMQGEITRAVADHLGTALSTSEKAAINRPPTTDPAAYDLYLRARESQRIFKTPGDARVGYANLIALLEKAVARDPNFAFAYCELAKAHDALYSHGFAVTSSEGAVDHRSLAEDALAKARRLRPDAGEVHLAQAAHYYQTTHDEEQAGIEVNLARNSLPNSAEVEQLAGQIARRQNHWDEAVRCLEKSVELGPREKINRFTLANTYRLLRRYDDFARSMDQLIATMTPDDSTAYRLFRAMGSMERSADLTELRRALGSITPTDEPSGELKDEYGLVLALCAHDPEAISRILAATNQVRFSINGIVYPKAWFEAFAARMRHDPAGERAAFAAARIEVDRFVQSNLANGRMLSLLAMIDAGLGNKEDALREAEHACELLPVGKKAMDAPIAASSLAVVYAWAGEPDLACATLERWVAQPAGSNLPAQPTYGDLCLNPVWEPLRGNARFTALVARLAPAVSR